MGVDDIEAPEHLGTWAWYVGQDNPERAWLLHPGDVWVKNPHFRGEPQGHPEAEDERTDEELAEEAARDQQAEADMRSLWNNS